jgi:hypothetical protein
MVRRSLCIPRFRCPSCGRPFAYPPTTRTHTHSRFSLATLGVYVADPLREWAGDKAASQKARIEEAATKKDSADVSAKMRPKDALDIPRQAAIRTAFLKAYTIYAANCYGKDEVLPESTPATCRDSVYLAETLTSSLDTLHLMDLDAEYKRAHEYIEKEFAVDQDQSTSVHQAATRAMASLLATFDWTHECLYMKKARGAACDDAMRGVWWRLDSFVCVCFCCCVTLVGLFAGSSPDATSGVH